MTPHGTVYTVFEFFLYDLLHGSLRTPVPLDVFENPHAPTSICMMSTYIYILSCVACKPACNSTISACSHHFSQHVHHCPTCSHRFSHIFAHFPPCLLRFVTFSYLFHRFCQGRSALDVAREANHTDLLVAFQEKAGLFDREIMEIYWTIMGNDLIGYIFVDRFFFFVYLYVEINPIPSFLPGFIGVLLEEY